MVLAHSIEQSLKCPDCGTYYEQWDPKQGGHVHAYWAKLRTCIGCKTQQDQYAAQQENNRDNPGRTNGMQVFLERNESAPGLRSPVTLRPIRPN